jgi:hypothetical protein
VIGDGVAVSVAVGVTLGWAEATIVGVGDEVEGGGDPHVASDAHTRIDSRWVKGRRPLSSPTQGRFSGP